MISHPDHREAVTLIDEAVKIGARLFRACAEQGICPRTYRRWTAQAGAVKADGRPEAARPTPANALSEEERQKLVPLSCPPEFARLPPSQIVPLLADRGEYYARESRFYRVLKAHNLHHHRGRAAVPIPSEPKRPRATGPNQVWVWDITGLPGAVLGTYSVFNNKKLLSKTHMHV
jgi:transposase-like protein